MSFILLSRTSNWWWGGLGEGGGGICRPLGCLKGMPPFPGVFQMHVTSYKYTALSLTNPNSWRIRQAAAMSVRYWASAGPTLSRHCCSLSCPRGRWPWCFPRSVLWSCMYAKPNDSTAYIYHWRCRAEPMYRPEAIFAQISLSKM